jgi:hypothetical protein
MDADLWAVVSDGCLSFKMILLPAASYVAAVFFVMYAFQTQEANKRP